MAKMVFDKVIFNKVIFKKMIFDKESVSPQIDSYVFKQKETIEQT